MYCVRVAAVFRLSYEELQELMCRLAEAMENSSNLLDVVSKLRLSELKPRQVKAALLLLGIYWGMGLLKSVIFQVPDLRTELEWLSKLSETEIEEMIAEVYAMYKHGKGEEGNQVP